jgi:hypothetical protein
MVALTTSSGPEDELKDDVRWHALQTLREDGEHTEARRH